MWCQSQGASAVLNGTPWNRMLLEKIINHTVFSSLAIGERSAWCECRTGTSCCLALFNIKAVQWVGNIDYILNFNTTSLSSVDNLLSSSVEAETSSMAAVCSSVVPATFCTPAETC